MKDNRLIYKDGNGNFWEVVDKETETRLVVVKLNSKTLTRDKRTKTDSYPSGFQEGVLNLSDPSMSHVELYQDGIIPTR